MSDRTINFGESETEATYQIQDTDSTGGGNFVVAKDTNANTVLLQYDPATDTWEYAADVDMNGGNVSGVGTLTAESVNTESATIGGWGAWEEVDSQSVTGQDALTISLNGKDEYLISYGVDSRSNDSIELTLDGDDTAGNENYAHYDESGVGNGDEDAFLLYDPNTTNTVTGGGIIHIIDVTDDRTGLPHSFGFRPAIIGRIDEFSQAGGYDDGPVSGLTQATITGAGTDSSSGIRMEVLGR